MKTAQMRIGFIGLALVIGLAAFLPDVLAETKRKSPSEAKKSARSVVQDHLEEEEADQGSDQQIQLQEDVQALQKNEKNQASIMNKKSKNAEKVIRNI